MHRKCVDRAEVALDSALHMKSHKSKKSKKKSLSEIIHEEMRANAEAAMALVSFRDKCIATIVTVLYLVYPTVVKSTLYCRMRSRGKELLPADGS